MNTLSRSGLWQRLRDAGHAEGDVPPESVAATAAPWYVRTMLGFAGWLGALFLLGFVGAAFSFVFKSPSAALVAGIACCAAAGTMLRARGDGHAFGAQFGLALSMAGQGMVVYGVMRLLDGQKTLALFLLFAFEAVLAAVVANFLHRLLCAWAAGIALAFALQAAGVHGLAPAILAAMFALVWTDARRWAAAGSLWSPLGYGLALAMLVADSALLTPVSFWGAGESAPGWLAMHARLVAALLVGGVLVFTVLRLLSAAGVQAGSPQGIVAIAGACLVALASIMAHGLDTALLILLLGFAVGNRALTGLGILALLGFLCHFYYQLHATLLEKSLLLAASGMLLLAVRLWLLRRAASGLPEGETV